jgi:hypothetical protein
MLTPRRVSSQSPRSITVNLHARLHRAFSQVCWRSGRLRRPLRHGWVWMPLRYFGGREPRSSITPGTHPITTARPFWLFEVFVDAARFALVGSSRHSVVAFRNSRRPRTQTRLAGDPSSSGGSRLGVGEDMPDRLAFQAPAGRQGLPDDHLHLSRPADWTRLTGECWHISHGANVAPRPGSAS